MKILVVTQYYWPEQFRINDICEELVRRGHEVTVLTGQPNYPEGELYPGYEDMKCLDEEHGGVRIKRCKMRPRHRGALNLMLNYASFALNATLLSLKANAFYDVVYVYGISPITSTIPAIAYKRKYGIPVMHYCCDLWPESVLGEHNGHRQMSRRNPVYLAAKAISRYVYNNVDLIACKCGEFIEYLHDVCAVPREKAFVLYEYAEASYLEVNDDPENNGVIDFMFLGNMGAAQNCDQILWATSQLTASNPFMVHFVGSGSDEERLRRLSGELGLDNVVRFHGRCPVSEVKRYYDLADVCLLTLTNRTATGLTPPAKLSGYMAAARPVIASINGAARAMIEEAECGVSVVADDTEGLRRLMQLVIDDPSSLSGMGMNGRKYFLVQLTLERHVDILENRLRELSARASKKKTNRQTILHLLRDQRRALQ